VARFDLGDEDRDLPPVGRRPQHVLHDLRDRIDLLINDGPAPLGIESTIVACLDGVGLLRPGAIPDDLEAITRDLVPELQRRGAFRTAYEAGTLRGLLGLHRPASRHAQVGSN